MAFYVGEPISAITHYSKVRIILKDIELEDLMDISQIKIKGKQKEYEEYKLNNVPKYKVYEFDKIVKLKKPIKRGSMGAIQNMRITTLDKLNKATHIREL